MERVNPQGWALGPVLGRLMRRTSMAPSTGTGDTFIVFWCWKKLSPLIACIADMSAAQEPVRPVPGWDAPGGEAPQPAGLLPADAPRLRGRQHPQDRTMKLCHRLSAFCQHPPDRTLNLCQPSVSLCQHPLDRTLKLAQCRY